MGRCVTGKPFSASQLQSMSLADLQNKRAELSNARGMKKVVNTAKIRQLNEEIKARQALQSEYMAPAALVTEYASLAVDCVDTENKVGYNCETAEDTQASIDADKQVLQKYEDMYSDIISSQTGLEKEAVDFEYPNLEKITSSQQADAALKKVEQQIKRIETLIKTAEAAINVLNKEKETAEKQLETREAEYTRTQQEMERLKAEMDEHQTRAQEEADKFVEYSKEQIERFIQEYQNGGYQQAGITIEEFLASKVAAIQAPASIESHSQASQNLNDQLTMKGEQLKLIGGAIDNLKNVIANIDQRLEVQQGKLEDYKTNLNSAKQYKSGLEKIKTQYQQLEAAQRKKKKKWYKRAFNRIVNAVKNTVKSVIKSVKKAVQGIAGAVGGVLKFVGKSIGHVVDKYAGLDSLGHGIEATGKFAEGAANFVGGLVTADKNEIKEGYKQMEDNALQAVATVASAAAAVATGGTSMVAGLAAGSAGDAVRHITDEVGRFVDRRLGLDSLGHGIEATGEFVDGVITAAGGIATADKDEIEEGVKQAGDNALAAAGTGLSIAGAIVTGGVTAGLTTVIASNATSEIVGRETGNDLLGAVAGMATGAYLSPGGGITDFISQDGIIDGAINYATSTEGVLTIAGGAANIVDNSGDDKEQKEENRDLGVG